MLDEIHSISTKCVEMFLQKQDSTNNQEFSNAMEKMIDRNHELLNGLGVGHAKLEEVVEITRKHSLHTKLTGAGGGGCALTFLRDGAPASTIETAKKDLEQKDFECFQAEIGCPGASYHTLSQIPQQLRRFVLPS